MVSGPASRVKRVRVRLTKRARGSLSPPSRPARARRAFMQRVRSFSQFKLCLLLLYVLLLYVFAAIFEAALLKQI